MRWIALGLGCILGAACASMGTDPAQCQNAVEHVKAYKAPGMRASVEQTVLTSLALETRPVQVQGWDKPDAYPDGRCYVTLQVSIGNERQRPAWKWDTKTDRVTADNDLAKRLSGW